MVSARGTLVDGKGKRSGAIIVTHNLILLDDDNSRREPVTKVSRKEIDGLFAGDVLGAGAVAPLFAAEVGLAGPDGTTPGLDASEPDRIENGRLILEEARAAIDRDDRGRLRKLCWWFPFVRRMPEVHRFLEGLPRAEAEQIAGLGKGRGRRPQPDEHIGLVATLEMLRRRKGSVAAAAEELKKFAHKSATHLQTLQGELGDLVRCLSGYQVPASEVPCVRWGDDPDDEFHVFVDR
jgi:hypothetical protein